MAPMARRPVGVLQSTHTVVMTGYLLEANGIAMGASRARSATRRDARRRRDVGTRVGVRITGSKETASRSLYPSIASTSPHRHTHAASRQEKQAGAERE
jgi:hypothetical protein